jgi:hypothetical protein
MHLLQVSFAVQPPQKVPKSGVELTCRRSRESTRGVGSPIGMFVGPVIGDFGEDWVQSYKCWFTKDKKEIEGVANPPAGIARLPGGDTKFIYETTKDHSMTFNLNGEPYYPIGFRVWGGRICKFTT